MAVATSPETTDRPSTEWERYCELRPCWLIRYKLLLPGGEIFQTQERGTAAGRDELVRTLQGDPMIADVRVYDVTLRSEPCQ